mgnify:CR=1 FL=1
MQLDEEQKSLLFHLVEGNRQMVYEDAKLVIWKEQEKFCCQVKEMWRDVTVAANGKIEVFFDGNMKKSKEAERKFFAGIKNSRRFLFCFVWKISDK